MLEMAAGAEVLRMQHFLAGIDGCSGGWVVALADEDFTSFALRQIGSISDLFSDGNAPTVVAVDMPIGLPERTGPKGENARASCSTDAR